MQLKKVILFSNEWMTWNVFSITVWKKYLLYLICNPFTRGKGKKFRDVLTYAALLWNCMVLLEGREKYWAEMIAKLDISITLELLKFKLNRIFTWNIFYNSA